MVSLQRRVATPFAAAGVPSSPPPSPLRDPAGSLPPSSHSPAAASERPARWPARAHASSRSPSSEARRHSCPARSPFLRRQAWPLFGGGISTDGAVQSATKDAGGSSRSEARSGRAALSAVRSEPSRASFAAHAEPLPSAVARRARGCSARARRCAIGRAPRLAAATLSALAGLAAAEIRRSGPPLADRLRPLLEDGGGIVFGAVPPAVAASSSESRSWENRWTGWGAHAPLPPPEPASIP